MKQQKNPYLLSYESRLRRYHEERQQLFQKNPMASPAELQEAIKRLVHKYRI